MGEPFSFDDIQKYFVQPGGQVHDEVRLALVSDKTLRNMVYFMREVFDIPLEGYTKTSEVVAFEVCLRKKQLRLDEKAFFIGVKNITKSAGLPAYCETNVRICVLADHKLENDLDYGPRYGYIPGTEYAALLHENYFAPFISEDKDDSTVTVKIYRPLTQSSGKRMLKEIEKTFKLHFPKSKKPRLQPSSEKKIALMKATLAGKKGYDLVDAVFGDDELKDDTKRLSNVRKMLERNRKKARDKK
jgi:hypothetical protein